MILFNIQTTTTLLQLVLRSDVNKAAEVDLVCPARLLSTSEQYTYIHSNLLLNEKIIHAYISLNRIFERFILSELKLNILFIKYTDLYFTLFISIYYWRDKLIQILRKINFDEKKEVENEKRVTIVINVSLPLKIGLADLGSVSCWSMSRDKLRTSRLEKGGWNAEAPWSPLVRP